MTRFWTLAALLALIVAGQLAFKVGWEAGTVLSVQYVPDQAFKKPLKLLVPFTLEGGYVRWSTTGMVVTTVLDHVWGPANTIYVLASLLTVVSFVVSWLAFRSLVFTLTFTLWMAFGPQFNFAWVNASCSIYYLLAIYAQINLLFLYWLLAKPTESSLWVGVGFVASLVVLAFCWETWLDYFVFLCVVAVLGLLVRHWHKAAVPGRPGFVLAAAFAVAVPYLAVRVAYGGNHNAGGSECELLTQHQHLSLMWEDYFSNVATYLFITVNNFVPHWVMTSSSVVSLGEAKLVAAQNGYHAAYAHFVPMHYHYFWHFHAGIVFCAVAFAAVFLLRRAFTRPTVPVLVAGALLVLVVTGFSTHSLIKFRPYLSVPVLAYKATLSILGMAVLLAYLTHLAWHHWKGGLRAVGVVGLAWSLALVCGLTHPGWQAALLYKVGLGGPPDPLRHYAPPPGTDAAALDEMRPVPGFLPDPGPDRR